MECEAVITLEVNDKHIRAQEGENVLDACRRAGISIPTLCHLKGLTPTGACRMCVVEVEGTRGLVPACAWPASDGMKVQTHSPRAVRARQTIVELLLAGHPDDCLYCVRNGECELQDLAHELGVRERRFHAPCAQRNLDVSSPSIVRDPAKCILCGKCVRVCDEVQGVAAIDFINRGSEAIVGTAFDQGLNVSSCVNCGQCVAVCPTGALREQCDLDNVLNALADPDRYVVVQHAPAVSVTLAEEFGMKPGKDIAGTLTSALRKLGFRRVFPTAFSADLTIMEEASELVERVQRGGPFPMLTSCSPGWIKFMEQHFRDFMPNVSSCKSPQQMMGAVIKSYYAEKAGIDPAQIFSVSIMPCTAKKFEAQRPEMSRGGLPDIDTVLTTRELARLIRMRGIDVNGLEPETPDSPLGERSSAGKLFAVTGGVMEAALRTAYHLLTAEELAAVPLKEIRGLEGVKQARIPIGDLEVGVAVVSGLANAARLLNEVRDGRVDLHFIEVMTCPGGCISGGGQPYRTDETKVRARMRALYQIDRDAHVRCSHHNADVRQLYQEFLGEPLGDRSHELLHTGYTPREVVA